MVVLVSRCPPPWEGALCLSPSESVMVVSHLQVLLLPWFVSPRGWRCAGASGGQSGSGGPHFQLQPPDHVEGHENALHMASERWSLPHGDDIVGVPVRLFSPGLIVQNSLNKFKFGSEISHSAAGLGEDVSEVR